jgi:hypothetical protein
MRVLEYDLGHGVPTAPSERNQGPSKSREKSSIDWGSIYSGGAYLTGFVVFVGSWIYCISHYGYLFGVGLGWLPSAIVGFLAGVLWPFIVLAVGVLLLYAA